MTFDEKVEFFGKHPFIPTILVGHPKTIKSFVSDYMLLSEKSKSTAYRLVKELKEDGLGLVDFDDGKISMREKEYWEFISEFFYIVGGYELLEKYGEERLENVRFY